MALLAATLLPASSEVLFVALAYQGYDPWLLWLFASSGNTAGSSINWLLGRYLLHFQDRPWFPFKAKSLGQSQKWFQKYGVWSLLLAWAPIVGDALTFIAGVMRVNFVVFVVLTGMGKGLRYGFLLTVLLVW